MLAIIEMPSPIPDVPCLCHDAGPPDDGPGCMCGCSERVLRHVIRGKIILTDEQKEWCLQQIESVEGYTRRDWDTAPDSEVAHGVLCAWTDYCRDKGLL